MSDDDDAAVDPKLQALLQQLKSAPVSTEDISLECTQLLARLRQIPAEIQSDQTALASEDFSAWAISWECCGSTQHSIQRGNDVANGSGTRP